MKEINPKDHTKGIKDKEKKNLIIDIIEEYKKTRVTHNRRVVRKTFRKKYGMSLINTINFIKNSEKKYDYEYFNSIFD
jgi:hypothetical protein